jgi:hypothetical protein
MLVDYSSFEPLLSDIASDCYGYLRESDVQRKVFFRDFSRAAYYPGIAAL